jgi:hypothetical protein
VTASRNYEGNESEMKHVPLSKSTQVPTPIFSPASSVCFIIFSVSSSKVSPVCRVEMTEIDRSGSGECFYNVSLQFSLNEETKELALLGSHTTTMPLSAQAQSKYTPQCKADIVVPKAQTPLLFLDPEQEHLFHRRQSG